MLQSLNIIGVNLGSNGTEINVSTSALRHMEFDRLTAVPKASAMSEIVYSDDEETFATSDGHLLSHLVGTVSEVGLDEEGLCSLYELQASSRKSRSSSNSKCHKSRKRAKVTKSPIVSQ